MSYYRWQKCSPWIVGEEIVYPIYAPHALSDRNRRGGIIWLFLTVVDLEECEHQTRHRIAFMDWFEDEVEYIDVSIEHQRKGLATRMFNLAKESTPGLKHGERLSDAAKAWIASIENDESAGYDIPGEQKEDTVTDPKASDTTTKNHLYSTWAFGIAALAIIIPAFIPNSHEYSRALFLLKCWGFTAALVAALASLLRLSAHNGFRDLDGFGKSLALAASCIAVFAGGALLCLS